MNLSISRDSNFIIQVPVLKTPSADAHKHTRGHLVIISGPALRTGAARLAATAGLCIGAGLVTIVGDHAALAEHAAQVTAIMLRERSQSIMVPELRADAAVIGPAAGLTDQVVADVSMLARARLPLVIDADALTVFAHNPVRLFADLHPAAILTPHAGEFARLFPDIPLDDRVAGALQAASRSGANVILKGAQSIVASPDGRYGINTHAAVWLATAGSGDVLAGISGGLLALGMDPFNAACAAVWIHGDIGVRAGPGLTADAMPAMIAKTLHAIWHGDE